MAVAAFIFFAVRVPETKAKTLEEIEQEVGADSDGEFSGRASSRASEERELHPSH